jgi:hypothetical protein
MLFVDASRVSIAMIHIALHFVVPLLVAAVFYRKIFKRAFLTLIGTMLVDVDHVLADPIYDPARCSIGFHPLHTEMAILVYVVCFALPMVRRSETTDLPREKALEWLHLIGLGLLVHMVLDGIDCIT